jgi:leader peptidase (prepilin peptidase)/N-methyltransferase
LGALIDDFKVLASVNGPHYPDGTPRPPIAWLGLTAFLFGKRTSPTGSKLSWRHPLTEIFVAVLMLMCLNVAMQRPEFPLVLLGFWLAFMVIFALITVIDIEHRLILFAVIRTSVLFALIFAVYSHFDGREPLLGDHLFGGVLGFIVFFILFNGGTLFTYILGKIRGQEIDEVAFGFGDVMLSGLCGLILGWRADILAMFLTVFLGAGGALIYLMGRQLAKGKYTAFAAIPYGPYIIAATVVLMLYPNVVVNLLFGAGR